MKSAKLLTIDADYSLSTIRSRHLEHEFLCTDLEGFFEHVWTVHPLVGADPAEPAESALGSLTTTLHGPRHTVIEATVGYSRRLERLPRANFLLSQGALLLGMHRLVRKENISVIRVGDPYYLALIGYLVARLNRLPLVIRVNGNYDAAYESTGVLAYPRIFRRRSLEKRIERFLLPRADLVACGNQNNLEYAIANGAPRERATLFRIGNIISPVHFVEPTDRASLAAEMGIGGRPFLVYVSRLEPVKHPDDTVRVLAACKRSVPDLVLVLVGEGSMREDLARLARDLGVEDDVIFAGSRQQDWVARALTSATVVLSAVTGRALVEAALSGTAIVAYEYEWQSELLQSGESALLVPYRDVEAMAEAVCGLLEDRVTAACLARKAREAALTMMDPRRLIEHERSEYRKLLEAEDATPDGGGGADGPSAEPIVHRS